MHEGPVLATPATAFAPFVSTSPWGPQPWNFAKNLEKGSNNRSFFDGMEYGGKPSRTPSNIETSGWHIRTENAVPFIRAPRDIDREHKWYRAIPPAVPLALSTTGLAELCDKLERYPRFHQRAKGEACDVSATAPTDEFGDLFGDQAAA